MFDPSPVRVYSHWRNLPSSSSQYELSIYDNDTAFCHSAETRLYDFGQLWYNWSGSGRYRSIDTYISLSEHDSSWRLDIRKKYAALTCPATGEIVACCKIMGEGDKDEVIDDRRLLSEGIMTGNTDEEILQLD